MFIHPRIGLWRGTAADEGLSVHHIAHILGGRLSQVNEARVQGISATFCHREAKSGAKRVGAMTNTRTARDWRVNRFVFVIELAVEDYTFKIDSSAVPIRLLEFVSVA